jgi:hypothetical protein
MVIAIAPAEIQSMDTRSRLILVLLANPYRKIKKPGALAAARLCADLL